MGTVLKACDIFVTTIYRLKAVRGKEEEREERQEKRFQQKRPHEGPFFQHNLSLLIN